MSTAEAIHVKMFEAKSVTVNTITSMRYTSTRNKAINVSFEEALTAGYASDGGLFVPQVLPQFTPTTLQEWIHTMSSYSQLMYTILRMFIDATEISNDELQHICFESVAGFDDPINCIPVIPFFDTDNSGTNTKGTTNTNTNTNTSTNPSFYVAELFHGPTFCFKDLGMRTVIHLLYRFTQKKRQPTKITLLVSTTGDTGPAAAQTIHDINDPIINIVVHYPYKQISAFQEQQLRSAAVDCAQIELVAFHGGGDDMDIPIKNLLASKKLKSSSSSSSLWTGVNSYNIGRPITQIVLYIWTYICIARDQQWSLTTNNNHEDQTEQLQQLPMIDIVLPTGAMGNIVAGYMSQIMGLPIRTLVAAVNINDIMYQTINYGTFQKSPRMERTLSEAINIQIPYNFERMIYYITNENDGLVQEYYNNLESTEQKITIPSEYLQKIQSIFQSARVTDEQMCDAIRIVYETYNQYVIDPHTAVAFSAAIQLQYIQQLPPDPNNNIEQQQQQQEEEEQEQDVVPPTQTRTPTPTKKSTTVILATASPCKFEHSVSTAVGSTIWNIYVQSTSYPDRAKHILQQLSRVSPPSSTKDHDDHNQMIHYYTNPNTMPISEIQKEWEERTRQLIQELEKY